MPFRGLSDKRIRELMSEKTGIPRPTARDYFFDAMQVAPMFLGMPAAIGGKIVPFSGRGSTKSIKQKIDKLGKQRAKIFKENPKLAEDYTLNRPLPENLRKINTEMDNLFAQEREWFKKRKSLLKPGDIIEAPEYKLPTKVGKPTVVRKMLREDRGKFLRDKGLLPKVAKPSKELNKAIQKDIRRMERYYNPQFDNPKVMDLPTAGTPTDRIIRAKRAEGKSLIPKKDLIGDIDTVLPRSTLKRLRKEGWKFKPASVEQAPKLGSRPHKMWRMIEPTPGIKRPVILEPPKRIK